MSRESLPTDEPHRTISKRVKELRRRHNISSQAALAQELGLKAWTIEQREPGPTKWNLDILRKIAQRFSVSVDWLLGRDAIRAAEQQASYNTMTTEELIGEFRKRLQESQEPDPVVTYVADREDFQRKEGREKYEAVPYMEDAAAAGEGRVVSDRIEGYVLIHERVAKKAGDLVAVRVKGNSMEPTLSPGSIAAIDLQDNDPHRLEGKMVCARTGEGVTIKRLADAGHCCVLEADNPSFKPRLIQVDPRDVPDPIIGRVVWAWSEFD